MWLFLTQPYKWPISVLVQGKVRGWNSPCGSVSRPLIGGPKKCTKKWTKK